MIKVLAAFFCLGGIVAIFAGSVFGAIVCFAIAAVLFLLGRGKTSSKNSTYTQKNSSANTKDTQKTVIKCSHCGATAQPDQMYCPECGYPINR